MTALILRAMQLVEIVVRKLRTICQGFLHAFVETTMRNAVPNWPREARRRDQSLSPATVRQSQNTGEDPNAGR
jgi:hypothetical protein